MALKDYQVRVYQNLFNAGAGAGSIQMPKGSLIAAPQPSQTTGLVFSQRFHGGYAECDLILHGSLIDLMRWYYQFMAQHLEVTGAAKEAYQGFVDDLVLDRVTPALEIRALGYWYSLDDQIYDTTSETEETFDDAVHWALSQQGVAASWRGSFLDGVKTKVTDTGTTVRRRLGETGLETTREAIEQWTDLGDSSGNRYWGQVTSDRKVKISQESAALAWFFRSDQANNASFRRSRSRIFNSVKVSYLDVSDGARKLTAESSNAASQQLYGKRSTVYPAGEMNSTAAVQLADAIVADRKDPKDVPSLTLQGAILDKGMQPRPLWLVKPGHVMRGLDLVWPDLPLGEFVRGRNEWIVRETRFNAETETLEIIPDLEPDVIEQAFGRALDSVRTLIPKVPSVLQQSSGFQWSKTGTDEVTFGINSLESKARVLMYDGSSFEVREITAALTLDFSTTGEGALEAAAVNDTGYYGILIGKADGTVKTFASATGDDPSAWTLPAGYTFYSDPIGFFRYGAGDVEDFRQEGPVWSYLTNSGLTTLTNGRSTSAASVGCNVNDYFPSGAAGIYARVRMDNVHTTERNGYISARDSSGSDIQQAHFILSTDAWRAQQATWHGFLPYLGNATSYTYQWSASAPPSGEGTDFGVKGFLWFPRGVVF